MVREEFEDIEAEDDWPSIDTFWSFGGVVSAETTRTRFVNISEITMFHRVLN